VASITDVGIELDRSVQQAFDIVRDALVGATSALIEGDRDAARAVTADHELDELHVRVVRPYSAMASMLASQDCARQTTAPRDLR
jgi:hypothetical protein